MQLSRELKNSYCKVKYLEFSEVHYVSVFQTGNINSFSTKCMALI